MSISFGSSNANGIYYGSTKVWPAIPSDMDFMYLANDFASGGIPNRAANSDMSNFLAAGSLTKNGSGSSCYLSNGNSGSNYLYIDLTTARLNAMQATGSYYTFFVRAYQSSSGLGGLLCWRMLNSDAYIYMLRCNSGKLQVHGTSGVDTLNLSASKVFKVTVNGTNVTVNDMEGSIQTVSIGSSRNMAARMTSFNAGYPEESILDRMYGVAGIARQTTATEDAVIRDLLLTQD